MPAQDPDQPPVGRLAEGVHRLTIRVYYEDTDAGGIVYHASYLRFFERGRTEMLALAGAGRGGAGEGGYVVADVHLRYLRPARLGEALVVETRVLRVRTAACVVQQRVTRVSRTGPELLVDSEVTLAFVGADGRPRRQPAAWVETFRVLAERALAEGAKGEA